MRIKTGLVGLAAGVAFVVAAGAAPAQAGTADAPPDGFFYVWEHNGNNNGGGAQTWWEGDDADYRFNGLNGNWNDRVSSLDNNGYPGDMEDVLLFEHIDYRGSSLCVPNGAIWGSMPAGWNDRVSSHKWVNAC